MITPNPPPVKSKNRDRIDRCIAWIDKHPRLGWYLAVLNFLNLILNVLDLFH